MAVDGAAVKRAGDGTAATPDAESSEKARSERFLRILQLVVFIDLFGVALVIPLLYRYATNVGADAKSFGLLGSIYSAAQVIGSPFMGVVSDKYGRRTALQMNFAGAGLSYLIAAFAPSFLVLCVARIPVGIVKQTMMISSAYAAQLSDTHQRSKAIGRMKSMVTLAFMVGPVVGGQLAAYDLKLPALVSAALFLADFFIVQLFLPHIDPKAEHAPHAHATTHRKPKKMPIWQVFTSRPVVTATICTILLLEVGERLNRNSLAIVLQDKLDLDSRAQGMVWSYLSAVATAMGALGVPFVARTVGDHISVKYGTLVAGVAVAVWAGAPSIASFFLAYTLYIAASFCAGTCLVSVLTHEVHPEQVGSVLGTVDSLSSLVGVVAPLAAGFLSAASTAYPPAAAAVFCVVASALAFTRLPAEHQLKLHED